MPTVESSSVRKPSQSSLEAAYLAAARESEEEEAPSLAPPRASAATLKEPPPSAARSPSPADEEEKEEETATKPTTVTCNKLSMSEELRTQICSNKYCQCIRRDGKMHRVQDLVRARLKEHVVKQKRAQQEQLEAQARDFLASLDQPLIATVRPINRTGAATATATTTTTAAEATATAATAAAKQHQEEEQQVSLTASPSPKINVAVTATTTQPTAASATTMTTTSPPTRAIIKNPVSYHQAVQAAVKRLDPKVWKTHARFSQQKRRVEATWEYAPHQQQGNNINNTTTTTATTTFPRPTVNKRLRASVTVPQTIQTSLLHSKRGSFRHRRPSELTVASELTAQSVVAMAADHTVLPAAKALHTLTDEEEAAIISLATATGNGAARWSTRASLPSVRFFARTSATAAQQQLETAAAQRNY